MMPQLGSPLYPVSLVAADIGLAGVLFLFAPVLGVLMAAAALLVTAAIVFHARGDRSFHPQPDVSHSSQ